MQKIIASDFDGTITTKDTLLEFIRYAKGNTRFVTGFLLHAPLLVAMKLHLYPNWKAKQRVFSYFFGGMDITCFDALCRSFAESFRHLIRPGALEMLRKAEIEGTEVVIVSASIDNWVQPFFPNLRVAGTKIEVVDGIVTGRFTTPNCYGEEKVVRLKALFPQRESYHLTAYGDSRGDKELLEYADERHYKPFRS